MKKVAFLDYFHGCIVRAAVGEREIEDRRLCI